MIPTINVFGKRPRVTLVGAGPGDPELLTVKAVNALSTADVVLFDALVSQGILDLIPADIPTLSVGKRARNHALDQDQINELIVEYAYRFGHVVRLKGGDPFVFGRGTEESEFARAHGLDVAVVPGISSALAVPAAIGVPVTARGVSESFWVITGTTKSGQLSKDIALAARSSATLVILMGISRIREIMDALANEGKGSTPVAVIQNGTMPNQKSVIGSVDTIAGMMKIEDIASPGIIIVGDVVRFANELRAVIEVARNYE